MEEIPHFPKENLLQTEGEDNSEKTTDRVLASERPRPVIPPLHYELELTPSTTARVELKDKPEIDFERRHEIKEQNQKTEQVQSSMVPLGQILEQYPKTQYSQSNDKKLPSETKPSSQKLLIAKPLYRKALLSGLVLGMIVGSIGLVLFLAISR